MTRILNTRQLGVKEQDLGDISGDIEIDFRKGQRVIANPTAELTITSANGASTDHVLEFALYFKAVQTINWPANTIFSNGSVPDPSAAPYLIVGSMDKNNVMTIDGAIPGYATL